MINGNGQPNNNNNNNNNNEDNNPFCGEKYLIKKILIGDTSDNIKCCSVNNSLLEPNSVSDANHIYKNIIYKNIIYKNIYKNIANNIINDSSKYQILKDILNKIRRGIISSADNKELECVRNFYENTVLMDFQMLPSNLKNELIYKFNNLI
jgi:hypothetical protein